jgi:transposase
MRNFFVILEFCTFMGFIHGVNRHEEILFPERLDDYIVEANPVRFIDAFVDNLNLTTLGFQRATPAATGRPADQPADRLKRYIDGYLYRLRSRRGLAQEPYRHVDLRWRFKKRRPAHKTIAAFRQHNLAPLRQVCRACTVWGKQLDRCSGELVAIDGSTFKAATAKARNFTQDQLKHLLQHIAPRVEDYRKELDGRDNHDEAGTPGGVGAEH